MKVFGKWDVSEIEFRDPGMARYINADPFLAPKGKGPANERFSEEISIVERLVNKLMRSGRNTGKKTKTFKIVEEAFDVINEKTGENPVQLLVKAVENTGPREETVRLKYGGIAVQKPVDASPQRRVNVATRLLAEAVHGKAQKNPRGSADVLADEIIKASNYDMESYAIKKKEEMERVASAAR